MNTNQINETFKQIEEILAKQACEIQGLAILLVGKDLITLKEYQIIINNLMSKYDQAKAAIRDTDGK